MTTTTSLTDTAVDQLLAAIVAGRGADAADAYADDAVLDGTVPDWRFAATGRERIAAQFARWFENPARFEELDRHRFADGTGEVVAYLLAWEERGVPQAAHHCHVLTLGPDGLVVRDMFWCGGRWDASQLAAMEAAAAGHAG